MGQITDMLLDGTLCIGCGEYLGQDNGYPGHCPSCEPEPYASIPAERDGKCQDCGRQCRGVQGLRDHTKFAHGPRALAALDERLAQ